MLVLCLLCPRWGAIRFIRAHPRPLGPRRPARRPPAALIGREFRACDRGRGGRSAGSPSRSCGRCRSRRCGSGRGALARAARSSCSARRSTDADGRAVGPAPGLADLPGTIALPAGLRRAGRSRAGTRSREALLRHRPGGRLPHGDGVPVRRRRLPRARAGAVWMRMRQPLVAGEEPSPLQRRAGRRRLRQRRQRDARLGALPLHQRRPQRPPGTDAGRRVGLPRRGDDPRAAGNRALPTALHDERGRSGAPCRRCSSASAAGGARVACGCGLVCWWAWGRVDPDRALADDHAVVRSGSSACLLDAEDGLEVVAEAGDVVADVRYVEVHRPTSWSSTSTCPAGPACAPCPRCARRRRRPRSSC